MIFRTFFLLFTASVRSRPPGPPAVPGVFWQTVDNELSQEVLAGTCTPFWINLMWKLTLGAPWVFYFQNRLAFYQCNQHGVIWFLFWVVTRVFSWYAQGILEKLNVKGVIWQSLSLITSTTAGNQHRFIGFIFWQIVDHELPQEFLFSTHMPFLRNLMWKLTYGAPWVL